MSYEIRRIENEKHKCPKCGGRTVKGGTYQGKPQRICKACGYHYTVGSPIRNYPIGNQRGKFKPHGIFRKNINITYKNGIKSLKQN